MKLTHLISQREALLVRPFGESSVCIPADRYAGRAPRTGRNFRLVRSNRGTPPPIVLAVLTALRGQPIRDRGAFTDGHVADRADVLAFSTGCDDAGVNFRTGGDWGEIPGSPAKRAS